MIPTIANIRKAIYCLNKRIDQLEGGNYQDTMVELSNKISALESLINEDLQDPTSAIDKFNEIVAFLNSIENTDTLSGLLGDIIAQIPTNVSDLENDSGYLTQHQDISNKMNKVTNAANNNLAKLDSNGNVVDSGVNVSEIVKSSSIRNIVVLTQAQYDLIVTKDANTEYNIIESV